MYIVLLDFADMQDGGYVYRAGDSYPRSGKKADSARLADLMSTSNRLGQPLIAEVTDKPQEEPEPVRSAEDSSEAKPRKARSRKTR